MSAAETPRLEVEGLTKSFGGIRALADVGFAVRRGSIHALLGENGAGKSTLVKIVTGIQPADGGRVLVDGEPVRYASATAARAAGVVAVYQDPKLFPHLDVAENIFMGAHPRTRFGTVARRRMYERARALLDEFDCGLDVRQPVLGLSIGEAQFVEFARAAAVGRMRVLFLDEPTAALTPGETERLFALVRKLRDAGTAVIFISHRLEEIRGFVDAVTVLRDGRHVRTVPAAGLTEGEVVKAMVGRDLGELYRKPRPPTPGRVRLEVRGLGAPGLFSDISFSVRAGEVVGLAGLVGAGRSEIALAIMGLIRTRGGTVLVDGAVIAKPTPRRMRALGVAYVPEDRDAVGLVSSHPIRSNLTLASLSQVSRRGILGSRREAGLAARLAARLRIKAGDLGDPVSTLSGGNRQKVVIGKWLAREPGIFILDEPTHGIDVGTKAHVHATVADLAAAGAAVLVISSDLPEVIGISDRVLVVRHGRLAAALDRAEATEERVMAHAIGEGRAA